MLPNWAMLLPPLYAPFANLQADNIAETSYNAWHGLRPLQDGMMMRWQMTVYVQRCMQNRALKTPRAHLLHSTGTRG